MKKLILIIFILSFINLINATTLCDYSQISYSYNNKNLGSFTLTCSNSGPSSVILTPLGESNLFSLSKTVLDVNSSSQIQINFYQGNPKGTHYSFISFSDNSNTIPIIFNVTEDSPTQAPCSIDIFPLVLTNIKIQQGETKTRNIQLTVPSCYNSTVSVSGVALQTDEKPIQLSELNLGIISPGHSVLIPIEINALGVSTGQYSDTLQLLLYDSKGNKIDVSSVSVSVLVSTGITPITNFSFSQLPTCSVDAITLSLNNTYKMTCSIQNPNIKIKPLIDTNYIIGKSLTENSAQSIYEYQAIKSGETTIGAEFMYNLASIGSPYIQDIKITPSGVASAGGVYMNIQFFQNGVIRNKDNLNVGTTQLIITDNSTGNLIGNYDFYLNGQKLANSSFDMELSKSYNLRIHNDYYNDFILDNLTISQIPLTIIITPDKPSYVPGEIINITSNTNVTILVNEFVVSSPYYITTPGNNVIKVIKDGYASVNKTIFVDTPIGITACTPLESEWKKGKEVICDLNKQSNWSVYNDGKLVVNNIGTRIQFKLDNYGTWEIRSNNNILRSIPLTKSSFLNWIQKYWYFLIGAGVIGFFVIVYVRKKNNSITPTYT